MISKPNPGLYVHVPFCRKKCNYCSFYSIELDGDKTGRFVEAVNRELSSHNVKHFDTLHVGGGTPSVLDSDKLKSLLSCCIDGGCREKTIEANPESLTDEKLKIFEDYGINRLSIGLQSTENAELKFLGRIHSYEDFKEAFFMSREFGFENINIDLICGFEGQTIEGWRENLYKTLEFNPEHISCYCLGIEKGTPYDKCVKDGKISVLSEDLAAGIFLETDKILTRAGYNHYEISNYARPGKESLHNLKYWRNLEYLGLGPSSWSCISGKRWWNVPTLEKYLGLVENDRSPLEGSESPENKVKFYETICLGLRLKGGIDPEELSGRFGIDFWKIYENTVEKLIAGKLLVKSERRICPTLKGMVLNNYVGSEFVLI